MRRGQWQTAHEAHTASPNDTRVAQLRSTWPRDFLRVVLHTRDRARLERLVIHYNNDDGGYHGCGFSEIIAEPRTLTTTRVRRPVSGTSSYRRRVIKCVPISTSPYCTRFYDVRVFEISIPPRDPFSQTVYILKTSKAVLTTVLRWPPKEFLFRLNLLFLV
jgi:hypothetical protein